MSVIAGISSSTTPAAVAGTQPHSKPELQMPEKSQTEPVAQDAGTAVDHQRLQQMIERANRQLSGAGNQHLSFGYEERLNRLYVQIKDNATGEVVREIPPQKLIEQQAAMSEMIGIIIDRNV